MMTISDVSVEDEGPDVRPERRVRPSLLITNCFLLLSLFVVVLTGELSPERTTLRYLLGILSELLLVGIALLFARLERLSIRRTFRLTSVDWRLMGLSAVLGVALWVVGVVVNALAALIFGYVAPVPPEIFPSTVLDALLLLMTTVVVAPLAEEIMFRGYVQRAYEHWGYRLAILITSVIFAIFHLRFQGVFALVPVALTLALVVWRTDSLFPAMILHATYNGMASLILVATSFLPLQVMLVVVAVAACLALLTLPLALGAFWGLWKLTAPPALPPRRRVSGLRRWLWPAPLILVLVLYGYVAVVEVIVGRFPEQLAVEAVELSAPPAWQEGGRWTYTVNTMFNQSVGEASCALTTQAEVYEMACTSTQEAFALDVPFSLPFFDDLMAGEATTWEQQATWRRDDLRLLTLQGEWTVGEDGRPVSLSYGEAAGKFLVQDDGGTASELTVPRDALIAGEWPWRLAALPFQVAYGSTLPLVSVGRDGEFQLRDAYVLVAGGEPVWTPSGNYTTWKVTVTYNTAEGEVTQSAWYDAQAPYTLVRYDVGGVSYLLKTVE